MRVVILLAMGTALAPIPIQAQPPPAVVLNGLMALADQGPILAVDTWFRGSRLENDAGTKQTFVEQFQIFGQAAGAVVGHDLIAVHELSPNYSTTYAIIRYERDPLFIAIEAYNGTDGWRLINIEFNDKVAEVFPASIREP